jgi:hypothetical protein
MEMGYVMLQTGTAIRFKGNNSDRMAAEFADSLRGHCALHGSKIVITKTTRLHVRMMDDPAPARVYDRPPINLNRLRGEGI